MSEGIQIHIIIPTFQRPELLKRSLESLVNCNFPEAYKGTYVIENGPKCGVKSIVENFPQKFSLFYRYIKKANKSLAINSVVEEINNSYLILTDDDVRFSKNLIVEYYRAYETYGKKYFFGGPFGIDYEKEPEKMLLKYLPRSAKGLNLGSDEIMIFNHGFNGINYSVHSDIYKEIGGLDKDLGPGDKTISAGQESLIQDQLISNGIYGIYLPLAKVWHYVPQNRCTADFALNRIYKTSKYNALRYKKKIKKSGLFFDLIFNKMRYYISWVFEKLPLSKTINFFFKFELSRSKGFLDGFKE